MCSAPRSRTHTNTHPHTHIIYTWQGARRRQEGEWSRARSPELEFSDGVLGDESITLHGRRWANITRPRPIIAAPRGWERAEILMHTDTLPDFLGTSRRITACMTCSILPRRSEETSFSLQELCFYIYYDKTTTWYACTLHDKYIPRAYKNGVYTGKSFSMRKIQESKNCDS